jgi:hypothetical protein
MRHHGAGRAAKIALVALFAVAALSALVMGLWNALMPGLFGLHALNFWQALGLLVLSRVLFGRFGRSGGGWRGRRDMMQRWAQMSPEEREQWRARVMRGGCGAARSDTDTSTLAGAS